MKDIPFIEFREELSNMHLFCIQFINKHYFWYYELKVTRFRLTSESSCRCSSRSEFRCIRVTLGESNGVLVG